MIAGRVYPAAHGDPDGRAGGERLPQIVVVGSASRDIAASDPRGWRLGGPATFASLALARLGLSVGCVIGTDADAAMAAELDLLRQAGVYVHLARLDAGPVFENLEDGAVPERRRQRWLSPSDLVRVDTLPEAWRGAPAWLLVPVAGELGPEWAAVPGSGAKVGLGWQGLLREFAPTGWVEPVPPSASAIAAAAGLVVASVHDLPADASLAGVREMLRPDAVLVATAGSRGGIAAAPPSGAGAPPNRSGAPAGNGAAPPAEGGASLRRYAAVPARVVDATGAGDVFLAALMAAWLLSGERPSSPRALRFAAAAASCSVERIGVLGVPTAAEVAARLRAGLPAAGGGDS